MVDCQQQATPLDLPFYDTFASHKGPLSKIFDDVITYNLWFGHPPIKNPGYACGDNDYLPPLRVTCDVIGQFLGSFWL